MSKVPTNLEEIARSQATSRLGEGIVKAGAAIALIGLAAGLYFLDNQKEIEGAIKVIATGASICLSGLAIMGYAAFDSSKEVRQKYK